MELQVERIGKQFKSGTKALDNVSFQIGQGEFVSVIGPSGAGKTTLFSILNGTSACDCGQILFDGNPFHSFQGKKKRALQKSIGTIYQDFRLVENSSCLENVLTAALPDMHMIPAILGLYGKERNQEAEKLLTRVGLAGKAGEPVHNLSGGQKQRVAIARALMRRPSILLADEPVASLDPVTGRQILELLKSIQTTGQVTILMNSHNLALSMEFSDRLIGLKDGCVIFDGPSNAITEEIIDTIYSDRKGCAK